jgi:four helix bundle protein
MSGDHESWRNPFVWPKALEGVRHAHRSIKTFPPEERFRLADQLCRAAVAVPADIAEGKGRKSAAEFRPFLTVARGSTEETRHLLLLAKDLGFLPIAKHEELGAGCTEVSKRFNAVLSS